MDKLNKLVKTHKNSLFVTVDSVKMNKLSKKEANKPIKMPKAAKDWSKAKFVKCAHCTMCGGCGYPWQFDKKKVR